MRDPRAQEELEELAWLRAELADLHVRLRESQRRSAAAEAERDAALRGGERQAAELARARSERDAAAARIRAQPQHRAAPAPSIDRAAVELRARIRELEQVVSTLAVGLGQTRADVERAASSRAWRYGHGVMRFLRRLTLHRDKTEGALARALTRIDRIEETSRAFPIPGGAAAQRPAPAAAEPRPRDARDPAERAADRAELARELRERLGPVPERAEWPEISIVVPTRDGRAHLERLLDGLRFRTDYPHLELVVVDNASRDGTAKLLARAQDELAAADAGLTLSVISNSDNGSYAQANAQGAEQARHDLLLFLNDDIEPFEPGWLRELVVARDQEGVAAAGATLLHGEDNESDRVVQHRSIRFRRDRDGVRPYNEGDGEDLFGGDFGLERRAPALTGACLLIDRAHFDDMGGFPTAYRYGTEDVDLGLTLMGGGLGLVASGRAVLFHRESATQRTEDREVVRDNRTRNRRIFLERWGPRVRRSYRLARLRRDPFWTNGDGPHAAITVTSLDPADGWGDWYTAHEIGDALVDLGWRITYVERKGERWYELPDDLDYVFALLDRFDLHRVPDDVVTIAWVRNWTERWLERPWFDRVDVLLASSAGSAELIERRTGRPSIPFPLAANPARFRPEAATDPVADVVFTGNRWGEPRKVEAALAPPGGATLAVYGKGWQDIPEAAPYARGAVAYDELPRVYGGARLVLDDTQGPTLPFGALNGRVFEALASGTLVVTDCEAGVRELFDEEFPVWRSPEELRTAMRDLLRDDEHRERLARRYRVEVLSKHTYGHRAARLVDELADYEERPSFCLKIGAPTWAEAERWGDLHFARAIERELRRRGHRVLVQVLEEWEEAAGLSYDIVLHLKGLSRCYPKPGQRNVLWCISHPDELTGEECDGYDLVFVASERFAVELRERTSTPVEVLEQATDPRVFYPDPVPEYAHDLVYVANSRNVLRPILRDLLPTGHDLAVYGANWKGLIDPKLVRAEHVPNDELRKVYSSARVVLADHWDDMRTHGFIANRIYDAVACGAFVICDDVPGVRERFGDAVAVYRTPRELRNLVDAALSGDRGDRPAAAPPVDTFADRVDRLLATIGRSGGL